MTAFKYIEYFTSAKYCMCINHSSEQTKFKKKTNQEKKSTDFKASQINVFIKPPTISSGKEHY